MRIYHDPITVQFDDAPAQFMWRGRLLRVLTVHTLTRETPLHWQHSAGPNPREIWRVEAENGPASRSIYELERTVGKDDWRLQCVEDA